MFDEYAGVDASYFNWHYNRMRRRSRNYTNSTSTSTQTISLAERSSSATRTVHTRPNTPFGGADAVVDQENTGLRLQSIRGQNNLKYRDVGGPFWKESVYVNRPTQVSASWHINHYLGNTETFEGYAHPPGYTEALDSISNGTFSSTMPRINDFVLQGHGATAISRTIPTKPEISLSTSIAELKDGLPSEFGQQIRRGPSLSAAGGEYLNLAFGYVPLVSDIHSVLALSKRYELILKQFKRDQGRMVRRRITLVDETNQTYTSGITQYAYMGKTSDRKSVLLSKNASQTIKTSQKVWFSGAYKLAYPTALDKALADVIEFNRVYGVIPTLETAWNLIPYSWLADWFTNIGDVIANASYLGSHTQLSYGYIMASTEYSRESSGSYGPTTNNIFNGDSFRVPVTGRLVHQRKRRLKANPFGFSVSLGSLTGSQGAILTALGLSRLKL